jgi:hypothetical protein
MFIGARRKTFRGKWEMFAKLRRQSLALIGKLDAKLGSCEAEAPCCVVAMQIIG